jgi:hypothetical protein
VRADGAEQRRGQLVQALPRDPAVVLDLGAAAEPQRPGREAEAAGREQARRGRAERAHGRQHRAHHEHGARREQRDRHEVVHGADEPAQPVDQPAAALAPVPAEVDEEREEYPERHEAEPDQVPVALLERRHADAPRRRRRGATGARLAACGRRHASGSVFDAPRPAPPWAAVSRA